MNKIFSDEAWEDYLYWQAQDKKTLKRINQLIQDIDRNQYDGIGKPELLKENLSGFWSRREIVKGEKNQAVAKQKLTDTLTGFYNRLPKDQQKAFGNREVFANNQLKRGMFFERNR